MSETESEPTQSTTAAIESPPGTPPATPRPTSPRPAKVEMTSEQLTERLRSAETSAVKKLLAKHGFEKAEDLDARLLEHGELKRRVDELSPVAQRAGEAEKQFGMVVGERFNELSEPMREAIDAEAKGDPATRLRLMRMFKVAGAGAAPPAAPSATPPANVNPSPAPAPSGAPSKFQEWETMKKVSPAAADIFYSAHTREIERTRPAS